MWGVAAATYGAVRIYKRRKNRNKTDESNQQK